MMVIRTIVPPPPIVRPKRRFQNDDISQQSVMVQKVEGW